MTGSVVLPAGVTLNVGTPPGGSGGGGTISAPVSGAGTLNVVSGWVRGAVTGSVAVTVTGTSSSPGYIAADISVPTVQMGAYSGFAAKLDQTAIQISTDTTVTVSASLRLASSVVANWGTVQIVNGGGMTDSYGSGDTWLNYGKLKFANDTGTANAYLSWGRIFNLPGGTISKTGAAAQDNISVYHGENDGTLTSSAGVLTWAGYGTGTSPVGGGDGISDGLFSSTGSGGVGVGGTLSTSTTYAGNVWADGVTGSVVLPAGVTLNVGFPPWAMAGGGSISALVSGAGTLNVVGGYVSGPVTGNVLVTVTGTSAYRGYIAADISVPTVQMGAYSAFSGTVHISTDTTVTVSGSLQLTGGVVSNAGTVQLVDGGSIADVYGANETWLNYGKLLFANNSGTSPFTLGWGRLLNPLGGTVAKTGTAPQDVINGYTGENDGTVRSEAGVLCWNGHNAISAAPWGDGVSDGAFSTTGSGYVDLSTVVSASTTYTGNVWVTGDVSGSVYLPAGMTLNVGIPPGQTLGGGESTSAPVSGAGTLNVVSGIVRGPVTGNVMVTVTGNSSYPGYIAADISVPSVQMSAYSGFAAKLDSTAVLISTDTTVTYSSGSTPIANLSSSVMNNGTIDFRDNQYFVCPGLCYGPTGSTFSNTGTLIIRNPDGSFLHTFQLAQGTFDNTGVIEETGYYPEPSIVFNPGVTTIHRGSVKIHNMADAPWVQSVRDDAVLQGLANGIHLSNYVQGLVFAVTNHTALALGSCANISGTLSYLGTVSGGACVLVDPTGQEVVALSFTGGGGLTVMNTTPWDVSSVFQGTSGTVDAGAFIAWRSPLDRNTPVQTTDIGGPFICQNGAVALDVGVAGQHCWGPQNDVPYSLDDGYPVTADGVHTGYLSVGAGFGASFALTGNYTVLIDCGQWYRVTLHACPSVSTTPPSISGTPAVGQTLTASTGTWTDSPTYTYQWKRCTTSSTTSCTAIGGATTNQYLTTTDDEGKYLTVVVTATASGGDPVTGDPAPLIYIP